jgi:hypothetical protein
MATIEIESENGFRQLSFTQISGVTNREEAEQFLHPFRDNFNYQLILDGERPRKNPKIHDLVVAIQELMVPFIRRYGGTPVKLTPEHAHIVDTGRMAHLPSTYQVNNQGVIGVFMSDWQSTITFKDNNLLVMAKNLVHETIHFNQAGWLDVTDDQVYQTRIGLRCGRRIIDPNIAEVDAYRSLSESSSGAEENESATEMLSIEFDETNFGKIPLLTTLLAEREAQRKAKQDRAGYPIEYFSRKKRNSRAANFTDRPFHRYSYYDQRLDLSATIANILTTHHTEFSDFEEVFYAFAKASLSGEDALVNRLKQESQTDFNASKRF